jgi:hypothetical protein
MKGKAIVRVGDRWMKVVGKRTGKDSITLIRPVEFFCGPARELQSNSMLASVRQADSNTKFIHLALTHTNTDAPISWRFEQFFVDRDVAIADFNAYRPRAIDQYFSAFISYEAWNIFFDDSEENIIFPIWRAVLEIHRKVKIAKIPRILDGEIKLFLADLDGLEEIEDASRSLLSAPTPTILQHLDAPVRLVQL